MPLNNRLVNQPFDVWEGSGARWITKRELAMPRTDFGLFADGNMNGHHYAEQGQFVIYHTDERRTYIYDASTFSESDERDITEWAAVAFDAPITGSWPNFIADTTAEES